MKAPRRVLCIMDLALAGRSSLAVAVPVLAACGVQACMLPAALFSTHTGGFGKVRKKDETVFCAGALQHFLREDITFDAVYTGYLYGEGQFALAAEAMGCFAGALRLTDPALGDGGKPYSGIGDEDARHMRALAQSADLITPNYTESALLCGEEPTTAVPDEAAFKRRMEKLSAGRCVLVTSVPTPAGGFEIRGCGPDYQDPFAIPSHHVPQSYPGTGDAFAAALCGLVLQGHGLQSAARHAADFVEKAVAATWQAKGEVRHGIWLEPFLPMLALAAQQADG